MVIQQAWRGPNGEPYCCRVMVSIGDVLWETECFWTEAEAWAARDRALAAGYVQVQVLGAPCVVTAAGFVPEGWEHV